MGRWVRLAVGFAVAAVPLVALAAPAAAAARGARGQDLVVLSGRAVVEAGETVRSVVVFHGSAVVRGRVLRSVVAFDAPVTVSGRVGDQVVVFHGLLRLLPGSRVGGDVYAERRDISNGATVDGTVRGAPTRWVTRTAGRLASLAVWLAVTVSLLLLGLLMVWLTPRGMDAAARSASAVGPAIGWGFGLFVGLPVAAILVMVTLVGIPLGLGVLFALALLFAMGHTVSAWLIGRLVMPSPSGRYASFLIGWVILRLAALVPWAGGLVWFGATVYGLGVLAVATWRARRPMGAAVPPMPVPPAPVESAV